jgi:predicted secreted hydrolase
VTGAAGWRRLLSLMACVAMLAGCAGSPILANAPVARPTIAPSPSPSPRAADPQPITFPRDDAPHDRLTEWWYYTGHLTDQRGRRFGFEDVVFRAERGAFPVSWASHLALTDEQGNRFLYAQRSEVGPQVDLSPSSSGGPSGFAFSIAGNGSADGGGIAAPWLMSRESGVDRLTAGASPGEVRAGPAAAPGVGNPTGFGIDLELRGGRAVLHNANGWIDFGRAGGSYYYSRPRLDAAGTLTLADRTFSVTGTAWFDHQWGDFIAGGGGGWDWFAVNLGDGTDLTLSLVRDASGRNALVYGTLVDGTSVVYLPASAFTVAATATWTSPATGATYPAAWHVEIPAQRLSIDLTPTVAGQELDTRATTGVTYWEGSQHVHARRAGSAIGGESYVELTGYGPSVTPGSSAGP